MTTTERRPLPRRAKSRGVALVELALSLIFLVPLMLGMLDFGYYFYVASSAEEAARAGVRQAARAGSGPCTGGGYPVVDTRAANVVLAATGTDSTCNGPLTGGDAACYMNQAPLMLGGASNITVTAECFTPTTPVGAPTPALPGPAPIDPTWRVRVQVDFPLPHPFLFPLLKHSVRGPPLNNTWVYYIATATSSP
jgi:hypothetical protein